MLDFKEKIAELIAPHTEGLDARAVRDMTEIPQDGRMGDYAFPCFRLAKTLRKAPPRIAEEIAAALGGDALLARTEAVNGYVNIFLSKPALIGATLEAALSEGARFGGGDVGGGRKVIVEYSSPNIAKPFHIGHIRSTVIGNAINNICAFLGYDTVRINHLGDYGTQFGKMIVAYRRWGDPGALEAEPIKSLLAYYTRFHEEAEKDPALEAEAREAFARLERGEAEERALWQRFRDESLKEFGRVYEMLGIRFDSYAGESFYSDKMDAVTDRLEEKGLLAESDGARIVDLSAWDMPPALIRKKDGSTLYITRDIAAAVYRKEHYDFHKNLYVVASQQNLHFRQWFKVIEMMGFDWAEDCVHIPFGLVSLEDGTMSTRAGRVVFLEEVLAKAVERTREIIAEKNVNTDNIEETAVRVGIGAVIYQELSNNRIKDYVFSWDKILNFDGETGPYVQYSYARASSVLRRAEGAADEAETEAREGRTAPAFLEGEAAYALAKLIYAFPDVVREAGEKYEPSLVTRHVTDVAQAFNRFYRDEHILADDAAERRAKLALVHAARRTIGNGLGLLGIHAPERM